ncbi:MAG: FAD-binding oxidoreductase [Myxococcota bacterium]
MATETFLAVDGTVTRVPAGDVQQRLRSRLRGTTLGAGDAGYEEGREVWNAMIDRRPALIAQCADAQDVQRCVRFAREHGITVTVRGAGHNIAGRAVGDGALLVDGAPRRRVHADPRRGVVEVEPGATLGDVDEATEPHGWVVPSGIVSETGLAGLTLGGGFGWLSRRFGLTCDHLIGVEMVTGEGDIVSATEETHPDLFWALRGGGGGCGIVTRFQFRPRALEPTVMAGPLIRPSEEVEDAFDRFRRATAGAPEEMTCMLKLGAAPPAPFLPEDVHGTPVAFTVVCHTGEPNEAERDLASLRAAPAPLADLIQPRPFPQFQSMFDAGEPRGRRDYWKSEYITDLDDHIVRVLLDAHQRLPSPHANIKVFQLGGAVSRVAPESSAAGHRDARFIVVVASAWESPADDAANMGWVRDTWSRVHARSGRGGYVNFLTDDVGAEERARAFAGVDLDRLQAIRKRYDPDQLFASA